MSYSELSFEVVTSSLPALIGVYVYDNPHLFKSQGPFQLCRDPDGVWTFNIHNRPYYASTTRAAFPVGLDWCSYPGKSPITIIIEKIYVVRSASSRNTFAAMYGHHSKEPPSPNTTLRSGNEITAKTEQSKLASHFDTWYATHQQSPAQSFSSPAKAAPPSIPRTPYASSDAGLASPNASLSSSVNFATSRPATRSSTPTQLSRPTGSSSPSVPRAPLPDARPIVSVTPGSATNNAVSGRTAYPPAPSSADRGTDARAAFVAYLLEHCQHAGSPKRRVDHAPPPSPTTVTTALLSSKPAVPGSANQSFSFSTPELLDESSLHLFNTAAWREQTAARDAKDARDAQDARELWERRAQAEAAADRLKHHQDLCAIYVSRGVHHHVYNPIPESTDPNADFSNIRNVEVYKAAAAKAGEDARRAGEALQVAQSKARTALLKNPPSPVNPVTRAAQAPAQTLTHSPNKYQPKSPAPEDEKLFIHTESTADLGRISPEVSSPPVRESESAFAHTPARHAPTPQTRTPITAFPSSPLLNLVPLSSIKKDRPLSVSAPVSSPGQQAPSAFPAFLPFSNPSTPIQSAKSISKPQRARADSVGRAAEVRLREVTASPPTSISKSRLGHASGHSALSPSEAAAHHAEIQSIREGITRLEASLSPGRSPESPAQSRADALVERWNDLRDATPPQKSPVKQAGEHFPTEDEMVRLFRKDFHDERAFEHFAFDARDVISQVWPGEDSMNVLVHHILLPLYQATLNYVNKKIRASQDTLAKAMDIFTPADDGSAESVTFRQVWLLARQQRLYTEIVALSDREASMIFLDIEPVTYVHSALQGGVRIKHIDGAHMTVPALVRRLLRAHALAALSEPRGRLHPAPGTVVTFRSDQCKGILDSAVSGDDVEVVLSGLYFDHPGGASKCVVPSLVRPV